MDTGLRPLIVSIHKVLNLIDDTSVIPFRNLIIDVKVVVEVVSVERVLVGSLLVVSLTFVLGKSVGSGLETKLVGDK